MDSLRAARPISQLTYEPALSGPRCTNASRMRSSTSRSTVSCLSELATPQIPHMQHLSKIGREPATTSRDPSHFTGPLLKSFFGEPDDERRSLVIPWSFVDAKSH